MKSRGISIQTKNGYHDLCKGLFDILADGHSSDQLYELNFYSVFDKLNFVCING